MDSSARPSAEQQVSFLETLYGDLIASDCRLAITFLKAGEGSPRTEFSDSLSDALKIIANGPPGKDIYFALGLMGPTVNVGSRGTENDVVLMPAFFADIDIKGPGHKSKLNYPASMEAARELVDAFPLKPSITNATGGGLHCFWILADPWHVSEPSERQRACQLSRDWNSYIRDCAKERGYDLDPVGELCRLARVPATFNHKLAEPRPVLLGNDNGERFTVEQLAALVAEHKSPPRQLAPVAHALPLTAAPHEPGRLDVERWLRRVGREVLKHQSRGDGSQVWLITCPRIDAHSTPNDERDCSIRQESNGRMGAKCFHSSCGITDWHALTAAIGKPTSDDYGHKTRRACPSTSLANFTHPVAAMPTGIGGAVESLEDEPLEDSDNGGALTFPAECLEPGGILGETMNFILENSKYPQPELALAACLTMMGTYAGRKVCDEADTRTNIYVVGLAPPAAGKEAARKGVKTLMNQTASELLGSERLGSGAGVVTALDENPAQLMLLDEFGHLLESLKPGNRDPGRRNAITILMQLFSSADSTWIADCYADRSRVKKIHQPCLSIYGTSTPDKFFDSLTSDNVSDGFLGRLLAFEGRGYVDSKTFRKKEPPAGLLQPLRWWANWRPSTDLAATSTPQPKVLTHSPEARERFERHADDIAKKRMGESTVRAAIWSRTAEKTAKLALIHACSRAITEPDTIELADVEFAIRLSNHLTRVLVRRVAEHVSDSAYEADLKKVLRTITGAGPTGLTKTQLQRATQWLETRRRNDVIQTLAETQRIRSEQRSTKGRPVTYYLAATVSKKPAIATG